MNGKIKKLVTEKGFGFIVNEYQQEYFFHMSALQNARIDEIMEGQAVTFKETDGQKGPRAEQVYTV